ncbi:MAG: conserved membrane protein of unknown function [Candidatus Thorarchaeota archaeon]|nr:MAG: conserved membrane protein of unknown function [Candidatus Thorarchaeota archaeon]
METEEHVEGNQEQYSLKNKIIAIIDVVVVRLVVYALIARGILILFFGGLETESPVAPYVIGVLWFIIPAVLILLFRRSFTAYGLTLENIKRNVDVGMSAFLIFALTFVGYIMLGPLGTSYNEPLGAIILTGIFAIVLGLILNMLGKRSKDDETTRANHYANVGIIAVILIAPLFMAMNLGKEAAPIVSIVVWQFVFSGFGEETFYRGYVQSRLNEAFGRPYEIRGVKFGMGLFITAFLFSLAHMLNTFDIYTLTGELAVWWGTFTFVGGLIFGLLREWSGSIVPGGLVHGLEAFGEAFGALFS